jgi:hypothetical protein
VVSGTNNRIPEALPCGPAPVSVGPPTGIYKAVPATPDVAGYLNVETRTAVQSIDNGLEGAVLLDGGAGNVAMHADAFGRRADDYRIPRYPYLFPPNPADFPNATQPAAFNGKQPNSALGNTGESLACRAYGLPKFSKKIFYQLTTLNWKVPDEKVERRHDLTSFLKTSPLRVSGLTTSCSTIAPMASSSSA